MAILETKCTKGHTYWVLEWGNPSYEIPPCPLCNHDWKFGYSPIPYVIAHAVRLIDYGSADDAEVKQPDLPIGDGIADDTEAIRVKGVFSSGKLEMKSFVSQRRYIRMKQKRDTWRRQYHEEIQDRMSWQYKWKKAMEALCKAEENVKKLESRIARLIDAGDELRFIIDLAGERRLGPSSWNKGGNIDQAFSAWKQAKGELGKP